MGRQPARPGRPPPRHAPHAANRRRETRLGIPLVYARDVIHGHRTVFPIPLGQAATWSPELIRLGARIAAAEAAADGLHWTFTPMLDIVRDPRWGRVAESFGEDPFLASQLATAAVEGYQGDDLAHPDTLAACAKHFVAYGAAEGGRDYNTVDIGPRSLHDTYLPPFKAAVDAGVATLMASFNEIDGLPLTANPHLLTHLLSDQWGFDGLLVSDWNAVAELLQHGIASSPPDAARLALRAGVDMDMVSDLYHNHLPPLIAESSADASALHEAARRVLRLKFRLGLFDKPYLDPAPESKTMLLPEYRQSARRTAAESAVLPSGHLQFKQWGQPWQTREIPADPHGYFGGSCRAALAHFAPASRPAPNSKPPPPSTSKPPSAPYRPDTSPTNPPAESPSPKSTPTSYPTLQKSNPDFIRNLLLHFS